MTRIKPNKLSPQRVRPHVTTRRPPPTSPASPTKRKQGEPPPPECVVLSGGISSDIPHAVAGALRWHKDRREKIGDFIERAKAEARAAGHRSVIVRGLKW